MAPPLARPWKFFTGDFIRKSAFFAVFQQKLQNSTMFDGHFFIRIQHAIKIAMWDYIWYDAVSFCVSEFPKKWAICGFHWTFKSKVLQLQGALPPDPFPPDQGICPWTLLGASPPDPVIGARLQCPICQILNMLLILSIFSTFSSWLRHCCGHPDQGVRWGSALI